LTAWLFALAVCCLAAPASAQFLPSRPQEDPQRLQQPLRAPITLLPSLTVTEEFNDNILLDNRDKRWDLITGFTPGITLTVERPTYRFTAGYNFTAEIFARETERNHAFNRQNFTADGVWRPTARLTLNVSDGFSFSTDTNLIATESVSTGRDRSWSNSLGGGAAYQITPRSTVRGFGSYTVQRFSREELRDSDVYRAEAAYDRAFTPQLTGTVGYQIAYFDIENEPKTTTHTPRVGVIYRFTPTLTVTVSAGPTFELRDDETRVTPAVTASVRQRMQFGEIGADFDRSVGTAGGLGGTTDNTSVSGFVRVLTLLRGLSLDFAPRYVSLQSDDDTIDVRSFTLGLRATYQFLPWVGAVAGYNFFHQRSDSTRVILVGDVLANDVDQNRVFVGVQFGSPIRFD
jgi:hypothetical protein